MSEKAIYMAALDIDNVDQSRLNELFTIVNSVQGVVSFIYLFLMHVFCFKMTISCQVGLTIFMYRVN